MNVNSLCYESVSLLFLRSMLNCTSGRINAGMPRTVSGWVPIEIKQLLTIKLVTKEASLKANAERGGGFESNQHRFVLCGQSTVNDKWIEAYSLLSTTACTVSRRRFIKRQHLYGARSPTTTVMTFDLLYFCNSMSMSNSVLITAFTISAYSYTRKTTPQYNFRMRLFFPPNLASSCFLPAGKDL